MQDLRPLAEISRLARLAAAGAIPESIRKCRRIATELGASSFALFFADRSVGAARLLPCFDECFPARSAVSAALVANGSEALGRHAGRSCLPARWSPREGDLADHPFMVRLEPILEDRSGLVMPVVADPIHSGIFVFAGARLDPSWQDVQALHRLCFEMFTEIASLKSSSATSAASVSKRELECLMLTAAGRTSEDIARILGLSVHTANQYLTTVTAKLDAVNRTQAVAKAIRLGLLE
jgi:DNA-binding CsgD family transcriptional regulator